MLSMMNDNDVIDEILSDVRQPLWVDWYIREKLGSGTSGAVFRGEAVRSYKVDYCAIKIIPLTAGDRNFRDEAQKNAFLDERFNQLSHESALMYKLKDCPNIVTIKDEYYNDLILNGRKEGYLYIRRMELLSNIQQLVYTQKYLCSEENIKKLAVGIGGGLGAAHANGILHRDVCPSNFYIAPDGTYKLGGFHTYDVPGTPIAYIGQECYMAPEVYLAKSASGEKYGIQAEIFSFGMCLYQLMNRGYLPFEGPTTTLEAAVDRRMLGAAIPPPCDASKEFAAIILKACAPDLSVRYQSIGQLLADLNAITRNERAGVPVTEQPAPEYDDYDDYNDYDNVDIAYTRPKRSKKSSNKLVILLVILIIVLLILTGLIIYALSHSKNNSDKSSDSGDSVVVTTQDDSSDENTTAATPEETTEEEADTTEETSEDTGSEMKNTEFVLDKTSLVLGVGQKDMPVIVAYPDGMTEADELWSSDDEDVATVDKSGWVTGVGEGECNIIIRSKSDKDIEKKIKVTVMEIETITADAGESPAPQVLSIPGLTYIDGILVANKSYSLPSDYNPGLDPLVQERFNALSAAAAAEGLSLWIGSGFRSYDSQAQIYSNYAAMDGTAKADTYSARPGHSEHQTGLALDCNTIDDAFGYTPESDWLKLHAHEYGFIIRYPQDKVAITGYKYEPWHLRYVGSEVASEIHDRGICLEEYLGIDSEYKD